VDAVLKGFLTDFPSIIGFVVINADGIPTKWPGPVGPVLGAVFGNGSAVPGRPCIRKEQWHSAMV